MASAHGTPGREVPESGLSELPRLQFLIDAELASLLLRPIYLIASAQRDLEP
jgi:hypothetical protein